MSERTQAPPTPVEERVEPPAPKALATAPLGRTYDEKAVADILQRAARLERRRSAAVAELTQAEIEQIASESGLDPALVRQAIAEREHQQGQELSTKLAGAPMRLLVERVVDREITTEEHERLAGELREAFAGLSTMPPQVGALGRSLNFTLRVSRQVMVEVSVTPRDGRTVIRLSANTRQRAGAVFGGFLGGFGGGLGTQVAVVSGALASNSLHLPAPLPVAIGATAFVGMLGAAYSLARAAFKSGNARLSATFERAADRLEAAVRAGGR